MALDNTLARKFASAVASGNEKKEKQTETKGVAKIINEKPHVILNGSTVATPVETTVGVNDGDELLVAIKDHRAMVIGNITSNAIDNKTFYRLLEDGSLNIAVNNLDVAADGSITISSGADFNVLAGAGVNLNGALVINPDGTASLNVSSFCIGDGEVVFSTEDLKGEPGEPGKDGADGSDGVDITSQYLYFVPGGGTYGGLNVVSSEGVSGVHTNIYNGAFRLMNGSTVTSSFGDEVKMFFVDGTPQLLLSNYKINLSLVGSSSSITMETDYVEVFGRGVSIASSAGNVGISSGSAVTISDAYGAELETYTSSGNYQIGYGRYSSGSGDMNIYAGVDINLKPNNGYINCTSRMRPSTDAERYLGDSSHRWKTVYASNGTINTSSIHTKENVATMTDEEAAKLLQARPVSFDYREGFGGSKGWYGLIAEELHDILPHAVGDWDAGQDSEGNPIYPGIYYSSLIPHLIKLCQIQQGQINALKSRVEALEGSASA